MDVTVVGSGPNGLATAVICARAGLNVQVVEAQATFGGGARSAADFEFPEVLHDVCSAVHPLALASPFFAEFDLPARGVTLTVPDIAYANPLPGRPAAIAYHDLAHTCAKLDDGASWRRLLGPLVAHSETVVEFMLSDKRSLPTALGSVLRLGLRMLAQGTPAWRSLAGEDARALFTGVAAHAISPLPSLVSAGAGLMLATLAHSVGWPIPVGGTQAIADALIADLRAHGGRLAAGVEITEPQRSVVVFDTAPTALLRVYRDKLPHRYAKALRRYRFRAGIARWTSCSATRSRGRIRGCGGLRPCISAAPVTRWRAPRQTSRRDATPTGRWCWPRVRTSPTPAASTKPAAVRSGPMPTCRRGPRSTRPRP